MCDFLVWSLDAIKDIRGPELLSALAAVATALIAFLALKNWKHQDKAKREAEFLDALIEAVHIYITEMPVPITLLEIAKIGMESQVLTWENGDETEKAVKGAIIYIEKDGKLESKNLREAIEVTKPSAIRLKSLVAKGQVFKFNNYAKCQDAITILTWHLNRLEAFGVVIGSSTWNWENPEVLKHLKAVMALNSEDIRKSLESNNRAVLEFVAETYERLYG